jgi:hypothetical protein
VIVIAGAEHQQPGALSSPQQAVDRVATDDRAFDLYVGVCAFPRFEFGRQQLQSDRLGGEVSFEELVVVPEVRRRSLCHRVRHERQRVLLGEGEVGGAAPVDPTMAGRCTDDEKVGVLGEGDEELPRRWWPDRDADAG